MSDEAICYLPATELIRRYPVLSNQSGHSGDGVPTGIQLVGPSYRDRDVFQAATAFETARGAWYRDPSLQPDLSA